MIQNENLLYDWQMHFWHRKVRARTRVLQKWIKFEFFPKKQHFPVIFKEHTEINIFFNFRPKIMIQNENLVYNNYKIIFDIEMYARTRAHQK